MSELKPFTDGYMKPPKHSRFQPGKSGNSNGRPKQPLTPYTALQKALKRKVAIKGEDRKISLDEALMRRLRDLALVGDRRAILMQQNILEMYGMTAPTVEPPLDVFATIERIQRRMQASRAAKTAEDQAAKTGEDSKDD